MGEKSGWPWLVRTPGGEDAWTTVLLSLGAIVSCMEKIAISSSLRLPELVPRCIAITLDRES